MSDSLVTVVVALAGYAIGSLLIIAFRLWLERRAERTVLKRWQAYDAAQRQRRGRD